MKRIIAYSSIIIVLAVAILFFAPRNTEPNNANKLEISNPVTEKEDKILEPETKQEQATISVNVIIAGIKFNVVLPENNSAYDAMRMLASSSKIVYHSQYYSGLGNFIDEINGVKANSQNYWIWYLNGMKANVGISSYKIKTGDTIEWKYEKAE